MQHVTLVAHVVALVAILGTGAPDVIIAAARGGATTAGHLKGALLLLQRPGRWLRSPRPPTSPTTWRGWGGEAVAEGGDAAR